MKFNIWKLLVSLTVAWFEYCPTQVPNLGNILVEWKNNHSNLLACDGKFSSYCSNSTKKIHQT